MATLYVRSKYLRVVHGEMLKNGYTPLELVVGRYIVDGVCYCYKFDNGWHDLLVFDATMSKETEQTYLNWKRDLGTSGEL